MKSKADRAIEKIDRVATAAGAPPAKEAPMWHNEIIAPPPDWHTTPPPARRWLLRDLRCSNYEGVLPLGKVGQLIAEGGAGKTTNLMQFAIAVATGANWLDTFSVPEPGRVLMLLAEEDAEEARRKYYHATRNHRPPPAGMVQILARAGKRNAFLDVINGSTIETPFATEFRDYVAASGPWALIILDPLSRLGGPDCETDNAAATRFVEVLESIVNVSGATVMNAHHTNKLGRDGKPVTGAAGRGSSALFDGVRWQASLTVSRADGAEDVITLAHTKSNYSRPWEPVMLRRGEGGVLLPLDAEERAKAAAVLNGEAARKARREERAAEKEAARQLRQDQTEAARAAAVAKREAGEAARRLDEERALVAVLRAQPGITGDPLRAALAAKLGSCSRDRMANMFARMGEAVRVTIAADRSHARGHTLDEAQLREDLR